MTYGRLVYIFGWLLLLVAAGHLLPLLAALDSRDTAMAAAFAVSAACSLIVAGALVVGFRRIGRARDRRVAFLTPVAAWLGLPAFAALPFVFSGSVASFPQAYFEAVSALTTTGATVLTPPLSSALVMWRAALCWFGGLSILVTIVAIYAVLDIGGTSLFYSALPRGEGATLLARLRGAVAPLLRIYLLLTTLCLGALWLAGLPAFDALCMAMTTVSTAGMTPWGTAGEIVGGRGVEAVLILFMLAASVNLTLYAPALRGRPAPLTANPEARALLVVGAAGAAVLALTLFESTGLDAGTVLWNSLFLSVSALSTSGFRPADIPEVPLASGLFMLGLVFVGGSVGSTAGGLKLMRLLILLRHAGRELSRLAHPHSAQPLKLGERVVGDNELAAVWLTAFTMFLTVAAGSLLLTAFGLPYQSAGIAALVLTANAGPLALAAEPAFAGYHLLEQGALWTASVLMIAGRLETALLLTLFIGAFWRR